MNFKRNAVLLLTAAMALGISACTGAGGTGTSGTGDLIGLCVRQESNEPDYYAAVKTGLENVGYSVLFEDSKNDQAQQNTQVQSMIERGCRLIIVEPVMVSAAEELVSLAKKNHLPLLLIDREPDSVVLESYDRISFVGCDPAQAGTVQAQLVQSLPAGGDLNGDGIVTYMMLRGPEDHLDAQMISNACNSAMRLHSTELLCTASAEWTVDAGRAACARELSQYGRDIEVILCNSAELALGAVEAVKNGGWIPGQDVYVIAVGANEELSDAINQGTVFGTVAAEITQRVNKIVETSQAILTGQTVEKSSYVEYSAVAKKTNG